MKIAISPTGGLSSSCGPRLIAQNTRDPLCGSDTSAQAGVKSRGTDKASSQPCGNCTRCDFREDEKAHKRGGSEFELSCRPAFLAEAASPLLRISTRIRNNQQQRKHRDPKSMPHQPLTTIYACRIFMRQIFSWMWMRTHRHVTRPKGVGVALREQQEERFRTKKEGCGGYGAWSRSSPLQQGRA